MSFRLAPYWLLSVTRILALVISGAIALVICLLSVALIKRSWRFRLTRNIFQYGAKWCCWICGYKVSLQGQLPNQPCLILPNHISYADILVLASLYPCCFVSKHTVKNWPLIGWLADCAQTIYVKRVKERELVSVNAAIRQRLEDGMSVVIFLESTTSNGQTVLPFRSALLKSVMGKDIPIVPVALKWDCDHPKADFEEHVAYWRDDHLFVPHLFGNLCFRRKQVVCTFGEMLSASDFECRKLMAQELCERVRQLYHL